MDLLFEPLQEADLDEFTTTYWNAFEPIEVDMIFPSIYPNGLQTDLLAKLRHRMLTSAGGNLASSCFCAKDASSNAIVGIARWMVVQDPPRTREEMEAKHAKGLATKQFEPPVAGEVKALDDAWFRQCMFSEMETMAGHDSYILLKLLAIHTDHQRQGVGTFLLEKCLEEADRRELPVYLDSSVGGKDLYERLGFKNLGRIDFDARDCELRSFRQSSSIYGLANSFFVTLDGGRSHGLHWRMVRPAHKPNTQCQQQ